MRTMTDTPRQKDDTRNLLADIELFTGLTPTQLEWVAQRAHRRVFEPGRNVLTIEQPGEAVYIILHGTVKIHIEQGERDVIISILGAGDLLGEMSLIDSVGRSASAVTLEDSLMLWMDKVTFSYMLDNFHACCAQSGEDLIGACAALRSINPGTGNPGCEWTCGAPAAGVCREIWTRERWRDPDPHCADTKRHRRSGWRLTQARQSGDGAVQGAGLARYGCGGENCDKDGDGLAKFCR